MRIARHIDPFENQAFIIINGITGYIPPIVRTIKSSIRRPSLQHEIPFEFIGFLKRPAL